MDATPDQHGGALQALANAYDYAETGESLTAILAFLRQEIACVAECFFLAWQYGLLIRRLLPAATARDPPCVS
jgi:hypothetical protein